MGFCFQFRQSSSVDCSVVIIAAPLDCNYKVMQLKLAMNGDEAELTTVEPQTRTSETTTKFHRSIYGRNGKGFWLDQLLNLDLNLKGSFDETTTTEPVTTTTTTEQSTLLDCRN